MRPIYRVVKHTYYEKCDVTKEYFNIQKQVKFLKWKWWEPIKQEDCFMGDCNRIPISFSTESDAIYAIKKLENGNIPNGWREEVTTVLDFNKE